MPSGRCVVQGCNTFANHKEGISLHSSPAGKSERDMWVRFVRTHRANFNQLDNLSFCSVVVITSALHAEGRRFEPCQKQWYYF